MIWRFENFRVDIPGREAFLLHGELRATERLVILGPSGCGKTTVLRAIAGLHPKFSGKIFCGPTERSALDPAQRKMAFVFQSAALFPQLSVLENVLFGLDFSPRFARWSSDLKRARAREYLARAQIADLAERRIFSLSGGEKQRVAFIRSWIVEPELFLLDEPFSALDATLRRDLQNWFLEKVQTESFPTILVTHDEAEAERLGTRKIHWTALPLRASNGETPCRICELT